MCYAHLTQAQRYQIEQLLQAACSVACIARKLGVHRSTIYRELNRGTQSRDGYIAWCAQEAAERRARRSAANHPAKPASLWRQVRRLLRRDWSPEQVRGWLLRFGQPSVSVPAIYAHVRANRRRHGRLYEHLRFGHKRTRWGHHAHGTLSPSRPSIHDRPPQVESRQQAGHWEGDTLTGSSRINKLLALVERKSRYLLLRRPARPWGDAIANSAVAALRGRHARSITFDNGTEFSDYQRIQDRLHCRVFFADPYHPGQRGTCENTIGLVRQYIPKGSSGRHLSHQELQAIANKLNNRPRKCLGFRTPAEVLLNAQPPVALRT
jgi:IS30 family transposase